MSEILQQAAVYLNSAAGVLIFAFAMVGLALTYAGLKIYWFVIFLAGMIPGALLGIAVGAAMGWPGIGVTLFAIFCAVVSGVISVYLTLLSIFLLGGLVGSLLAAALGAQEPIILIIAGILCGALFIGLHQVAIVIGTSFSGAGFLTYSAVNAVSIIRHGHPEYLPGDFISYLGRFASSAYRGGGIEHAMRNAGSDLLVFLFFFVTGMLVQFNFHKIFGGAGQKVPAKVKSLPGEERVASSSVETLEQKRSEVLGALTAMTAAEGVVRPVWQLSLFQDGVHQQTRELPEGRYLLGCGDGVDIELADEAVSQRHLEISVCPEGILTLDDLNSTAGTWKTGTDKVDKDTPESGQWYQVGAAQIVFQHG